MKVFFVISLCSLVLVNFSSAQNEKIWDKLGTKSVDFALDRDVVSVSNNKEAYTALKIKVDQGTINVYKATVEFTGGQIQDVNLPEILTKENDGKLIDLKNNKKVIEKITFWYDTKDSNTEKAVIEIWARK